MESLPALSRRRLSWSSLSEKTIEDRRNKLNDFLHAIASAPAIPFGICVDESVRVFKEGSKPDTLL